MLRWFGPQLSRQFHRFIFLNVVTVRKEVAEKVGIGFELPTQSSVVAPNAPKKSTNLQSECALAN
jgi:hypothetical protein